MPLALYNLSVNVAKSPEFDSKRPVASTAAVLRAIFLGPRSFYLNFDPKGSIREPIVFVLLVSAVAGILSVAANLIFGVAGASLLDVAALNLAFVVLSPILVGVAAGVYLLSVRTFVGPEGNFREVYRMLAYAYGAMILLPLPVINAFAFTYATMILMGMGIRSVYRTSFLTALVTTLVGFVPVSLAFLLLLITAGGFVSG